MDVDPTGQEKSLSKRALKTFSSQILAQVAGLIAGLLFTPIIIRGLQAEMYGAWSMIQKSTGFLGFTNLNSMAIIKLQLGVRQHSSDVSEKRRYLGANMVQWFVLLPFMLLFVGLLGYYGPRFIPTTGNYEWSIRWTLLIMGTSVPLRQLLSLPGGVLAGQNLSYKAMGLNAFVLLFSSSLNVAGVLMGYGIVTLAFTTIIGIILTSALQLYVAKKAINWFGIEKPKCSELQNNLKLSILGSLTSVSGLLLTDADTIVIGMVFGPAIAAVYATTGALVRFSVAPVQQLLGSGNPGISYLAGKKEWNKIIRLRIEQYQMALMCLTSVGVVIIVFNESFLRLWVGEGFYGGPSLTLALVVMAILKQLVNVDAIPLDAVLQLKPKLMVMSFFGVMSLPFGYLLLKTIGLAGYSFSLIFCYIGILGRFQFLLRKFNNIPIRPHLRANLRSFMVTVTFLAGAVLLQQCTNIGHLNWFVLISHSGMLSMFTGLIFFYVGISYDTRLSLKARARSFI